MMAITTAMFFTTLKHLPRLETYINVYFNQNVGEMSYRLVTENSSFFLFLFFAG